MKCAFQFEKKKLNLIKIQEDEDSPVKSNHKGFAFASKTL